MSDYVDPGNKRFSVRNTPKDVVNSLAELAVNPGVVGEVFNMGNDKEVKIIDLAKMVKELVGSNSEIILIPYDQAYEEGFEDMMRHVPDISKAQKLIGYRPTLDLPEILRNVIEYSSNKGMVRGAGGDAALGAGL